MKRESSNKYTFLQKTNLFLFFIYIICIYIYGEDPEKIKYSEIILILFSVIELILIIRKRSIKIKSPIIAGLVFAVYCFISSFWAINPDMAMTKGKTLFLLVVFLWLAYNFYLSIEDGNKVLLKQLIYAGTIFSIYVVLYYGVGEFFTKLIEGGRVGAEIKNLNSIGLETAMTVIISEFYAIYFDEKKYWGIAIIPLIVSLATGSRKAIVLIVIATVLLFIFNSSKKQDAKNILKKLVTISFGIIAIILVLRLPMFNTITERFNKLINGLIGVGETDNSTLERLYFIEIGIKKFWETPLLGVGAGNSGFITLEYTGLFTYLHNNFVELLATTGILGFILYYYIYAYMIINCIKSLNKNTGELDYSKLSLIILVTRVILDYGMVSYDNKNTYIYFLIALLALERSKMLNEKNS